MSNLHPTLSSSGYAYSIFFLTDEGHMLDASSVRCHDLGEATAGLSKMPRDYAAEVWRDGECLAHLPVPANDCHG